MPRKPAAAVDLPGQKPRLRRAYYECRYGQLHLYNAIPAGGGFDELTPVICLHASGETGQVFMPLLEVLGQSRSVYAPDMPGIGQSDPAPGVSTVAAAVNAVGDFIDAMRIRRFDLVARGDAVAAMQQIAAARAAAVRRTAVADADTARLVELLAR